MAMRHQLPALGRNLKTRVLGPMVLFLAFSPCSWPWSWRSSLSSWPWSRVL